MHRIRPARIFIVAAVATLLAASTAVGQLAPDLARPEQLPQVKTALITNANTPVSTTQRVDAAVQEAHLAIGGRITNNAKRNGFFPIGPMADRRGVVTAARDMADGFGIDIVFIEGGDSPSTVSFAGSLPNSVFVDIGQSAPCIDANGRFDPTGECAGGAVALPSNYVAIPFEVEAPAYLAGVLAASASSNDRLGIISGMADCDECNRYIQGFALGALRVDPEIDIQLAYLADEDEGAAFGDTTSARTFAEAFIDIYQPDVILPVAGESSLGIIEAACDTGTLAIGAGVDISARHPELSECILTSVTKDLESAIRSTMFDYSNAEDLGRVRPQTLASGGVALTPEWERLTILPLDTQSRYDDALGELVTGVVDPCPVDCGSPIPEPSGVSTAGDGGDEGEAPAEG